MIVNKFAFLLVILTFFTAACGNRDAQNGSSANLNKIENSSVNQVADYDSDSAINKNGVSNKSAEKAQEKPDRKAADDTGTDTADFTGTAGITEKKRESSSGAAILNNVRTAEHENYDRVVFEFKSAAELPGYHIEYIDKPVRACGSGSVVAFETDAQLEIRFYPANSHTEEGKPTIENREQAPNHKIIKELKSTCDFEAEVEWVLGVSSPNKYRVLELKNPARLAIDIKH